MCPTIKFLGVFLFSVRKRRTLLHIFSNCRFSTVIAMAYLIRTKRHLCSFTAGIFFFVVSFILRLNEVVSWRCTNTSHRTDDVVVFLDQ